MFYEKDQTVFICMHVCAFVSFPYCLCRKKKWQYGMNGDTASGWGEGENGTMTGGTNGEIETTGEGLLDDLTDDLSRGASDAASDVEGR